MKKSNISIVLGIIILTAFLSGCISNNTNNNSNLTYSSNELSFNYTKDWNISSGNLSGELVRGERKNLPYGIFSIFATNQTKTSDEMKLLALRDVTNMGGTVTYQYPITIDNETAYYVHGVVRKEDYTNDVISIVFTKNGRTYLIRISTLDYETNKNEINLIIDSLHVNT